jgi:CO/xanthine dehydrogenase Mo-binding subunit
MITSDIHLKVAQEPLFGWWVGATGITIPSPDKDHVEGMFNQPYAIPHYRVRGYLTDLEVSFRFWCSVGNSMNEFFMESLIDEMTRAAGRDPLAFRLDLAECVDGLRCRHCPRPRNYQKPNGLRSDLWPKCGDHG